MIKIGSIFKNMFATMELPKAVQIVRKIEDIPEAKIGYVYRYDPVGYYVGKTCKVFMPHRIKMLLQQGKVEEVDGENTDTFDFNCRDRVQSDRAVA